MLSSACSFIKHLEFKYPKNKKCVWEVRNLLKASLFLLDCFEQILEWKENGVSNLPGVISLLAGLLMWVTSLSPVRKQYFELFFYTHQLYVVFVVFFALHVGDFIFSMAAGGIFLFILDRFLRFCQSRRTVDIISATCLPCGTLELVLSKPGSNKKISSLPNYSFLSS